MHLKFDSIDIPQLEVLFNVSWVVSRESFYLLDYRDWSACWSKGSIPSSFCPKHCWQPSEDSWHCGSGDVSSSWDCTVLDETLILQVSGNNTSLILLIVRGNHSNDYCTNWLVLRLVWYSHALVKRPDKCCQDWLNWPYSTGCSAGKCAIVQYLIFGNKPQRSLYSAVVSFHFVSKWATIHTPSGCN